MKRYTLIAVCVLFWICRFQSADAEVPPRLPHAKPEAVGMDAGRLALIDFVIQRGLERDSMPGAVVLVGYQGKIVFLKAYGDRQLQPEKWR